MSPDSTDQPGPADPGGIHPDFGVQPGDPGARDAAGSLENPAEVHPDSPVAGVDGGTAGQKEADAGGQGLRSTDGDGVPADEGNGQVGAGRPASPGEVHPEVRTNPHGGLPEGNGGGPANPTAFKQQIAGRSKTGARISARDLATALKLTDPSWGLRKRIAVAAQALGVSEDQCRGLIDRDSELRAAYGTTGVNGKMPAAAPRAPEQAEILDREEDDLPTRALPGEKTTVELFQLVDAAEKEMHMKGLQAIGVNEGTLKKLRRLDGLASSTAAFIATGLENTHRLYYLAVIDLKTVADGIKERYLDLGADGNPQVGPDLLPYYYRNYIDAVKEFGRAYDLFLQGAAIILKIVGQNKDDEPGGKKKAKLGFSGRSLKQANPSDGKA